MVERRCGLRGSEQQHEASHESRGRPG